jgi:hypothetical protein
LSTDERFLSTSASDQSFGYDFKDHQRIVPTHYAIRSRADGRKGYNHPKSWVIEVTNDRTIEPWTEIDRQNGNLDLNAAGVVQTFPISHPPEQEFRYIRIRQTGVSHDNSHYLTFCALEVFGQLRIRNAMHREDVNLAPQ